MTIEYELEEQMDEEEEEGYNESSIFIDYESSRIASDVYSSIRNNIRYGVFSLKIKYLNGDLAIKLYTQAVGTKTVLYGTYVTNITIKTAAKIDRQTRLKIKELFSDKIVIEGHLAEEEQDLRESEDIFRNSNHKTCFYTIYQLKE